ncbi:HAD-IC family P-type ATPase, partial [bacterium]|nr:HAD-IC family P-type ATPase [bacterium]
TLSYLSRDKDKIALGWLAFHDPVKASSKEAIEILNGMNIKTVMLSGDNQSAADRVAKQLGIELAIAEVLPKDKAEHVERLKSSQQGGRASVVAMVGDGVNDAPALSAADVGLAMSTGTDVAMSASGVTLMRGDPLLVVAAIEISKKTYKKIQQNLFWAFIYNVIGIPLAALGYLSPMIAGGAMALSSVSVVANSLMLKRWKPSRAHEGTE